MLERKWPEKYNAVGHLSWTGRIYASYLTQLIGVRGPRIYHGTWGSALFQSIYQPAPSVLQSLITMPEWYLVVIALTVIASLGTVWAPLLLALPLLVLAIIAPVVNALLGARSSQQPTAARSRGGRGRTYGLTAFLHLLQPLARFSGRMALGLTPWRRRVQGIALPRPRSASMWSTQWKSFDAWIRTIEAALQAQRARTRRGGDYDRWDLEVRGGMLGVVRTLATVEEHGQGRQFTRVRAWPHCSWGPVVLVPLFAVFAVDAIVEHRWWIGAMLTAISGFVFWRTAFECANAMCAVVRALDVIGLERYGRGSR
jgi:hypothetical protein